MFKLQALRMFKSVQLRTHAAEERDKSAERSVGGWTSGWTKIQGCAVKDFHGSCIQVVKDPFENCTAAFQASFIANSSFLLGQVWGLWASFQGWSVLAASTGCSGDFSRGWQISEVLSVRLQLRLSRLLGRAARTCSVATPFVTMILDYADASCTAIGFGYDNEAVLRRAQNYNQVWQSSWSKKKLKGRGHFVSSFIVGMTGVIKLRTNESS